MMSLGRVAVSTRNRRRQSSRPGGEQWHKITSHSIKVGRVDAPVPARVPKILSCRQILILHSSGVQNDLHPTALSPSVRRCREEVTYLYAVDHEVGGG